MSDVTRWSPPDVFYRTDKTQARYIDEADHLAALERVRVETRVQFVNDDCTWGAGPCIPGCPTCKRLDDLYAERVAGGVEALREARDVISLDRDRYRALADKADQDSMIGRAYRDYADTHDADLAAIDRLIDAATTGGAG